MRLSSSGPSSVLTASRLLTWSSALNGWLLLEGQDADGDASAERAPPSRLSAFAAKSRWAMAVALGGLRRPAERRRCGDGRAPRPWRFRVRPRTGSSSRRRPSAIAPASAPCPPRSMPSDDAITGKAIGEFVHHRHGQRGQPRVLGWQWPARRGRCAPAARSRRASSVVPAQEQRLDPADSPVQLSEQPPAASLRRRVRRHRAPPLPASLRRARRDRRRSPSAPG
jgi:hypothetical protein